MRGWWVVLTAATGDEYQSSVMNRSGKMKLLLRSLLLSCLCTLSSWSVSSDTLIVTQSPDVYFQEGEAGNITCCWKGKAERVRIKWMKKQTVVKNKTINQSTDSQNEQASNCSVLIFPNIKTNVTGRYICKVTVEIPTLTEVEGNGTTITVTARKTTANSTLGGSGSPAHPMLPVILAVAVVVPLFLITLACFCSLRRKQGQAARVIYEVPHTNSIEAEMDKHSTSSSRGSTQWCEVAMYDSLDYFEQVETKRSK